MTNESKLRNYYNRQKRQPRKNKSNFKNIIDKMKIFCVRQIEENKNK